MQNYRFADFEVRPETGEIFKRGYRVRLQPQPFQILCQLLARPGQLVTRNELARALWGESIWTDSERGLNIAIKKLRDALHDSAETPKLIETLPRHGYRFIGVLEPEPAGEPPRPTADSATAPASGLTPPPPIRFFTIRSSLVLVSALAVLVLAITGLSRHFPLRPQDRGMQERLSVLVGLFVNETGERELDGVVENALEASLTASPVISVTSAERVRDALVLMRQPAIDRLPAALAKEVGRRDPGIGAVITGTIQKLGTGYLLTARILRNGSPDEPAVFQASARNRDEILKAAGKLSSEVHSTLGRHPPASASAARPERVTTSSPEAYRLYSDANELAGDGNFEAAEFLLRKALEMDARFASALILLAHEIRNQPGRPPQDYMLFAERALALSAETSEEEAYFIRASYYFFRGDSRRAIEVYEAMLKRFPEHAWANNNLYRLYLAEGLSERMKLLIGQQLKIRPNDPASYYRAGFACLCSDDGTPSQALDFADRGRSLTLRRGEEDGWTDADSHLRALVAWLGGDLQETRRQLESGAEAVTRVSGYITLGMFHEARLTLSAVEDPTTRDSSALWRSILAGDAAEASRLSEILARSPAAESDLVALLWSGRVPPMEDLAARLPVPRYGQRVRQVALGELRYRQGRRLEAIEMLRTAVESISHSNFKERLLGAITLSDALLAEGMPNEAVATLESVTSRRACGGFYSAMYWPVARRRLAAAYLRAGRGPEAARVRAELERLSGLAEEGFSLAAGPRVRQ